MNEENIKTLKTFLEGKIPKDRFPVVRKRLADIDDDKFHRLTNTIEKEFKSKWITFLLNWFGYLGPIYLGRIGKTIAFWLLFFLACALFTVVFVMPALLDLLGLGADTTDTVRMVLMVVGCVLSFILSIWWIFELFYSFSDTKKYNYQKFTQAISIKGS
ncbi:MAG: hypothetical protein J5875_11610 [Paludibacteraceae bacterium]|nr:hypothetical protein [Paludibacteraceae bacterium]